MRAAVFLLMFAWLLTGATLADTALAASNDTKTVATKKHKAKQVSKSKHVSKVKHVSKTKQKTKQRRKLAQRAAPRLMKVNLVLDSDGDPVLQSASALVIDQSSGAVLMEKNADSRMPIASITKLMTAIVVLDAHPDLQQMLTIEHDDVDTQKGTRSRLLVGTRLTREEMLRLALMSSENRAASALSRYYPGGREAFIAAMNRKAVELGMHDTHFEDPTGLTPENVSSARDLTKLAATAHQYPLIREFSTASSYEVRIAGRQSAFHNTNSLVKSDQWEIGLSKTGYINEAGKCLVMQTWLNDKPLIIVLLDSWGRLTRIADAMRIKRWIESAAILQRGSAG